MTARIRSLSARALAPLVPLAGAALLAGCASTQLDAQWVDPQLSPGLLRGARVMVACEAHEVVLKQICQDQLAAELSARGGTPVPLADTGSPGPGRAPLSDAALAAARAAGAKAVLVHAVTVADVASGGGMSVSIGGMSIGGGGGVGVGVSVPVGTPRSHSGYAIESRLTDAASGRVLLTAKASARPSADVNAQIAELTKAVFAAADQAKAF
ncbi:MAG: hypothetical protein U1E89_16380 [Burkholderiaceae bacterium]